MTDKTVLVLIDLQLDFLHDPKLEPHFETVVDGAARLLQEFRQRGLPVIHIRTKMAADGTGRMPHWDTTNRFCCVEGSAGYDAPPVLAPCGEEPIFDKRWFSAFTCPRFEEQLRALDPGTVVLAGVHLQTCIRQTALDAYQKGFTAVIAREACGSNEPMHGALTFDYLAERGIRSVGTTELLSSFAAKGPVAAFDEPSIPDVIASLRQAQELWAKEPPIRRVALLRKFAEGLRAARESLAHLIVDQVKKPIVFARAEVDRAVALLGMVAARAESIPETRTEAEGQIRYLPRGVVAMITPWNNPLAIPMGKLAPALAFGNAVVWKPSPYAPRVAHAVIPILKEAGLPPGIVEIVEGDERCARRIISSGVDAVAFSGSSSTGWSIVAQSASRLVPVQAELGGNNGAIIAASADLKTAADAVAEGAFGFAGQRCTSNRRAIVLGDLYEKFLQEIRASMEKLPIGDPWIPETRVTPMISAEAARRVARLVELARAAGLRVFQPTGMHLDESFHPPTIILCDDPRSPIVQEESFGPILVIQRARDFDHALVLLNDVRYGLVASLFSQDAAEQAKFLNTAQAGIVKLNASTVNAGVDLPFTGWKSSGYGAAEHGEANADFFTKRQSIYR